MTVIARVPNKSELPVLSDQTHPDLANTMVLVAGTVLPGCMVAPAKSQSMGRQVKISVLHVILVSPAIVSPGSPVVMSMILNTPGNTNAQNQLSRPLPVHRPPPHRHHPPRHLLAASTHLVTPGVP